MQSVINNSVCLPPDIREDRFSEYLSKCSHSSLALECHMSLLDYCHIVLIKTCHVIDLTFDIHFTDVSLTAT